MIQRKIVEEKKKIRGTGRDRKKIGERPGENMGKRVDRAGERVRERERERKCRSE